MTTDAPIEVDAKAGAKLFKKYSAPYVHGPFGPPTPPTVEQATQQGSFYSLLIGDTPTMVAIAKVLKSSSTHVAFDTREMRINAGDTYMSDIAINGDQPVDDVVDFLGYVQSRGESDMWVEIYEEDPFMRRVLRTADFAYRGTKVNAYGDLTGMYWRQKSRVLAADAPVALFDAATLTNIEPGFISERERDAILRELHDFAEWWSQMSGEPVWADHYSTYNKRNTWSAFSLRNYVPEDPTSIVKPTEMPRDWKKEHPDMLDNQIADSIAIDHFPTVKDTMQRLRAFGYAEGFERVRLMRLTAKGGELTRHSDITDKSAGTLDGYVSRLHIPFVTNEAVQFQMWDHRGRRFQRHLSACDLWYLDQRKPHAAVNAGESERVHLVIDVVCGESFRSQLADAHVREIETNSHGMQSDPVQDA